MGSSAEALVDWDIDRPWVADLKLVERLFATESFPKLYKVLIRTGCADRMPASEGTDAPASADRRECGKAWSGTIGETWPA